MSIEKIRNDLLTEARTEADRIVRSAQRAAEKQLEQARQQIREEFEHKERELQAHMDAERELELVKLRSAHRQELLAKKNAIINDIFDGVARQIEQLPQDQYLALLERWLGEIDSAAAGEAAANPRDLALLREQVLSRVNARRGPGAQLRAAAEPIDIRGGSSLTRSTSRS